LREKAQQSKITIRLAAPGDAEGIARLSAQLGYPSSPLEVQRRLGRIEGGPNHAAFVAVGAEAQIIGWVHVHASHLLESDPEAEIGGLVVDEACRGSGVGKLLMQRAEQWARERDLGSVYLRSNIIRKEAHEFYKKLGYSVVKTQYAFRKFL
jgi:GNAT superfamily N-acetyltransferase